MSKNIRTQLGKVIGKTLNSYHTRVKPIIDDLKFKEQYQGRIIDCMVGEVDDNYIETPETDSAIVKLEHSKEGLVKVPSIKGKTILVDADGNETDTPAEGCRLVSVGEEEDNKLIILSNNKNLYNFKDIVWRENKSLGNHGGDYDNAGNKTSTGFLEIPNYLRGLELKTNLRQVSFYSSKAYDTMIFKTYTWNYNTNFTIPNDAIFMRIETSMSLLDEPQIVISDVSNTNYVEPKQHKTEILLDEPLRSLPNGVCDEIVGNKLIRRVGKMVLNGSEYWERMYYPPSENGTHIQFSARNYFTNKNVKKGFWGNKNLFICDRFPRANSDLHWGGKGSIGVGGDDVSFMFTLSKSHELYTLIKNVSNLKEWLSENPITVIYQLAEPIVIEMPNSLTLQGFDDTTMHIENTITPTVQYGYNALIPYKEELRTQKEEVETNTLDIEQNIIPYLMDMEFNLMLMEDNE